MARFNLRKILQSVGISCTVRLLAENGFTFGRSCSIMINSIFGEMQRRETTNMFNIGMLELVLVLAVAFLVVGPKDLPKVARWLARQLKSIKKLIRQIKQETGWDEFA